MFQVLKKENKVIAYELFERDYRIVYGTRFIKRSDLEKIFPDYQFCFVKQVHGNSVIQASSSIIEADGHFTDQKNQALAIQTADCLPIFLACGSTICALHAGWRGIENQIVLKALSQQPSLCHKDLTVSVGPHIQEKNFVVDEDVALKLQRWGPEALKMISPFSSKYHVQLLNLVKNQILSKTCVKNFHYLDIDTFSSDLFYSFRKNSENKVGQTSFIVRI